MKEANSTVNRTSGAVVDGVNCSVSDGAAIQQCSPTWCNANQRFGFVPHD
jgi:hypothetical protein